VRLFPERTMLLCVCMQRREVTLKGDHGPPWLGFSLLKMP